MRLLPYCATETIVISCRCGNESALKRLSVGLKIVYLCRNFNTDNNMINIPQSWTPIIMNKLEKTQTYHISYNWVSYSDRAMTYALSQKYKYLDNRSLSHLIARGQSWPHYYGQGQREEETRSFSTWRLERECGSTCKTSPSGQTQWTFLPQVMEFLVFACICHVHLL